MNEKKQSHRQMLDSLSTPVCVTGVAEEERKKRWKSIWRYNGWKLLKCAENMDLHFQEIQQTPWSTYAKRSITRCVMAKMLRAKNKEKIWNAAQEKWPRTFDKLATLYRASFIQWTSWVPQTLPWHPQPTKIRWTPLMLSKAPPFIILPSLVVRIGCITCGGPCKIKMRAPSLKIKNFKMMFSEH